MIKFILYLILYLTVTFGSYAQDLNSIFTIETGISVTHSYWEYSKPEPYTYELQNISPASPFMSVLYHKLISPKLWLGVGVTAAPVTIKRSRYLRRSITSYRYAEWQFPFSMIYTIKRNLFRRQFNGEWQLETGLITTTKNPMLHLNNGYVDMDGDTVKLNRYDNGHNLNFQIPLGLTYGIFLPNGKIISIKGLLALGTRLQLREYIDREENLIIRSNASFLRLSVNYGFPVYKKKE